MVVAYAAARAAAPGYLVLHRVGEFYEALGGGDAVPRLLGIQLTRQRQKDAPDILRACGRPPLGKAGFCKPAAIRDDPRPRVRLGRELTTTGEQPPSLASIARGYGADCRRATPRMSHFVFARQPACLQRLLSLNDEMALRPGIALLQTLDGTRPHGELDRCRIP